MTENHGPKEQVRSSAPGSPAEQRSKQGSVPGSAPRDTGAGTAQGSPVANPGSLAQNTGVQAGMPVVGADGEGIGTVKDLQVGDFVVDRSMRPDARVPYSAVHAVAGGQVTLNVPASEADNLPQTSG